MILKYTLYGSEIPCELYAEKYNSGGGLALIAIVADDFDDGNVECSAGEEMATLTVNSGVELNQNQCVLDTDNNKNVVRDLEKQRLGHVAGMCCFPYGVSEHPGFCDYPIWEFSDREMRCFGRF